MRTAFPRSLMLALAGLFAPAALQAAEPFGLKAGDRVVFYGDSITDQRLYTTFAETFVVTRFPGLNVDFVHSGWSGDRVGGGGGGSIDVRLKRDVLAYKPTVMTIMLGMNDASYRAFDENIFQTYAKGYKNILDTVKKAAPGIRFTLIRPSPFDDVTRKAGFEGGYNAVLIRYGDYLAKLAKDYNATVADLNSSVVEATKKAYATDPQLAVQLNSDRVHPGPAGQLLMAAALLKAWNAPAVVSEVQINGTATKTVNAKVTDVSVKDGVISWTQTDAALPFPINFSDKATALAVASSTVIEDLNKQIISAANLEKPKYLLKIDGAEIGVFTKGQLEKGINIATLPTPMLRQASDVHRLTIEHNNIHFARWRTYQVPFEKSAPDAVLKANEGLDGIEAVMVARQRAMAQPKPHKFVLEPRG